jgi:hypothetical protein
MFVCFQRTSSGASLGMMTGGATMTAREKTCKAVCALTEFA